MRSQSQSSIESCTFDLLSCRPFHTDGSKTLDLSSEPPHKPYGSHSTPKRPCLSYRSTVFSIEALSRLWLADDDNGVKSSYKRGCFRPVERNDDVVDQDQFLVEVAIEAGLFSVALLVTTCSEFQFAVGTDSSGEIEIQALEKRKVGDLGLKSLNQWVTNPVIKVMLKSVTVMSLMRKKKIPSTCFGEVSNLNHS